MRERRKQYFSGGYEQDRKNMRWKRRGKYDG